MIGSDVLGVIVFLLAGLAIPLVIIILLYVPDSWVRALPKLIISLAVLLYLAAAFHVIVRASVVALDGRRYYTLIDDAMISMRYAWNFAHGHGLVWNPGEHVEGYTNLLMTLIMSVPMLVLDKSLSALAVQIIGAFFALGNAWLMLAIARVVTRLEDDLHRSFVGALAFACGLLYVPISYWPLIGGDLGPQLFFMLLGVLAAFRYTDGDHRRRWHYLAPISLGLSYLTRPDALIPAALVLGYVFLVERFSWASLRMSLIFFLFPLGQLIFRIAYYGELLPNTYILKVAGMPLDARLRDGAAFIRPFLDNPGWMIVLVGLTLIFRFSGRKLLAVLIALALIGYQVWAGGDLFPYYWRLLAPLMPLILIYFVNESLRLIQGVLRLSPALRADSAHLLAVGVAVMALVILNGFYLRVDSFLVGPLNIHFNAYQVDLAAALNETTKPGAVIGVTSAGTVPYYTDRRALDFLGKSDAFIARTPPRLGTHGSDGMGNLPGHVKYDLYYSIASRRPDYIERFIWGDQDLSQYVGYNYVMVGYGGVKLYFRTASPHIRWEKFSPSATKGGRPVRMPVQP